jgi:hypothetical protein
VSRVQEPTFRCDCGNAAPVTRGATPWEFDVVCPCGWAYRLSWAHHEPAPTFTPARPARKVEIYASLPWD